MLVVFCLYNFCCLFVGFGGFILISISVFFCFLVGYFILLLFFFGGLLDLLVLLVVSWVFVLFLFLFVACCCLFNYYLFSWFVSVCLLFFVFFVLGSLLGYLLFNTGLVIICCSFGV